MKMCAAIIVFAWFFQTNPAQAPTQVDEPVTDESKHQLERPPKPGVPFYWDNEHRLPSKWEQIWAGVG